MELMFTQLSFKRCVPLFLLVGGNLKLSFKLCLPLKLYFCWMTGILNCVPSINFCWLMGILNGASVYSIVIQEVSSIVFGWWESEIIVILNIFSIKLLLVNGNLSVYSIVLVDGNLKLSLKRYLPLTKSVNFVGR